MSASLLSSSSPAPHPSRLNDHRNDNLLNLFLHSDSPLFSSKSIKNDGDISPSFNASFASSMSISSEDVMAPSTTSNTTFLPPSTLSHSTSSDASMVDASPLPARSAPPPPPPLLVLPTAIPSRTKLARAQDSFSSATEYPFLQSLLEKKKKSAVEGASGGLSRNGSNTSLSSASPALREKTNDRPGKREDAFGSIGADKKVLSLKNASSRAKAGLPNPSRHTAPAGALLQAPPHPIPIKRLSEPTIPTAPLFSGYHASPPESSPFDMDVDNSPQSTLHAPQPILFRSISNPPSSASSSSSSYSSSAERDGSSKGLADLFHDMSPIVSRKRFLEDVELSPTPSSSLPSSIIGPPSLSSNFSSSSTNTLTSNGGPPPRRAFEKASSTTNLQAARRRRSSTTLNASTISGATSSQFTSATSSTFRRPGLTSIATMGPPATSHVVEHKRHAMTNALDGKPAVNGGGGSTHPFKAVRRAYSVADAVVPAPFFFPNVKAATMPSIGGFPGDGSPGSGGGSFFQTVGRRAGTGVSQSIDIGMMEAPTKLLFGEEDDEVKQVGRNVRRPKLETRGSGNSPLTGFRTQEEKGKALPCFGVKEDGLMRIDADTLNLLQSGAFSDKIKSYTVIDCRFSYEYAGGHIAEAVNLPTTVDIEQALLSADAGPLPAPSTSEVITDGGKRILIFHCEFSAKRAPTSAKHLRSKDRLINGHDYPNVHYPEVYVLQGGYAEFYKKYPTRCTGGYLSMDDPEHNTKRSVNLHAFRQQTRQFSRASSFTFGEAQSTSALLKASSNFVRPPLQKASTSFVFPDNKNKSKSRSNSASRQSLPSLAVDEDSLVVGATEAMSITEEEHEADTSFGTSAGGSSPLGDSPCPGSKVGRHSLKLGSEFMARRGMERAQTSSVLMFRR